MHFLTRVTLTALVTCTFFGTASWHESGRLRFDLGVLPALCRQLFAEDEREENLAALEVRIHDRMRRKDEISAELVAGRLTLPQATAMFRDLCVDVPDFEYSLRMLYPRGSDDERLCRYVISWVEYILNDEPEKMTAATSRLYAELDELLCSGGSLILP